MPPLPYWLWPGDGRPTREIDAEITEELQLHLDLMAEERLRRGETLDEAKRQAAERFGDFDRYLRLCRAEKQGDIPMLKRMQAAFLGAMAIVVGVIAWQQWAMSASVASNQEKMRETLSSLKQDLIAIRSNVDDGYVAEPAGSAGGDSSSASPAQPVSCNITIRVSDPAGNPIEGALASVCYKRSDGSRQTFDMGASDVSGRIRRPIAILNESDWQSVGIVCIAPGYGFYASSMSLDLNALEHTEEIKLSPSIRPRLRVLQPDGSLASRLSLFPTRRTDLTDRVYSIPDGVIRSAAERSNKLVQDSNGLTNELWKQTDDNGEVEIDWFAARDLAQIALKQRGQDYKKAEFVDFEVPEDPSKVVVIKLQNPFYREFGGGRGGGEFGGGGFGGEFGGSFGDGNYTVDVEEAATEEPQEE